MMVEVGAEEAQLAGGKDPQTRVHYVYARVLSTHVPEVKTQ